jgi:hypothetical protein
VREERADIKCRLITTLEACAGSEVNPGLSDPGSRLGPDKAASAIVRTCRRRALYFPADGKSLGLLPVSGMGNNIIQIRNMTLDVERMQPFRGARHISVACGLPGDGEIGRRCVE